MTKHELIFSLALMEGREIDYRCKFLLLQLIVIEGVLIGDKFTLKQCVQVSINKEKQTRALLDRLVKQKVLTLENSSRENQYTLSNIKTFPRKAWHPIITNNSSNLWFIDAIIRHDKFRKMDPNNDNRSVILTVIILILLADSYHVVSKVGRARLRKLVGVSQIKNQTDLKLLAESGFIRHIIPGIKKSLILGERATRYELDMLRVEKALGVDFPATPQLRSQAFLQCESSVARRMSQISENLLLEFNEDKLPTRQFEKLAKEFLSENECSSHPPPFGLLVSIDAFRLLFKAVPPHGKHPISHLTVFIEELSMEIVKTLRLDEINAYCDESEKVDKNNIDKLVHTQLASNVQETVGEKLLEPIELKVKVTDYETRILSSFFKGLMMNLIDQANRAIFEQSRDLKLPNKSAFSDIWITRPKKRSENDPTIFLQVNFQ